MARVLGPGSGLERFVHAIHVSGELDAAAGRAMEEAVDVRAERMAADDARLLPAPLDHVVPAFHYLVKVPHLDRDVVEAGLVGAKAEEQVVMLNVAFALHERAGVEHLIDCTEAKPADVEIDRRLVPL